MTLSAPTLTTLTRSSTAPRLKPARWTGQALHSLGATVQAVCDIDADKAAAAKELLRAEHAFTDYEAMLADGGARSTSNLVNCADYLLATETLAPLPLRRGDALLVNFGLHDYNLGLGGVPEYTAEYRIGLTKALALAQAAGATLSMLATTPAHNTASAADDTTVVALNEAAAGLAKELDVSFVDLHTPLIAACGPVPWADNGTNACPLCAPQCKQLSVHYTSQGYKVIQGLIYDALFSS